MCWMWMSVVPFCHWLTSHLSSLSSHSPCLTLASPSFPVLAPHLWVSTKPLEVLSQIPQLLLTMHKTRCSCFPWSHLETDLDGYQLISTIGNRHTVYCVKPQKFACQDTLSLFCNMKNLLSSWLSILASTWVCSKSFNGSEPLCSWWGYAWKWSAPWKVFYYPRAIIVTVQLSSSFSHISHTSFPPVPIYFKWKMLRTIRQSKNKRVISPRRKTVLVVFGLL